ncbi:MAG: cyclic nucleotide-binding domain-containing protein [Gammaproteobacteria bacterium]|nr:cyclic nucleotide-binding domain-containing protein [Gammaproteobacteria bacterium]
MPKTVIVNVIGFPERERRMIRNILSVASNQNLTYQMTDTGGKSTDVFVVNADDSGAMLFWNEYQQDAPEANSILASSDPMRTSEHVCIKRPLIASQLHGALTLESASAATSKQQQRPDILRKCFLFRNFSSSHLDKIVAMSRIVTLPGNYVVFEKGSTGNEMLVVLSGRLKVHVSDGEGREIVLGTVGPGEIVGELAMLDGRGRSATVTALVPSELLIIHRKDFMPFLEQNPKVATDLVMVLALRLRLNTEQLADLLDR